VLFLRFVVLFLFELNYERFATEFQLVRYCILLFDFRIIIIQWRIQTKRLGNSQIGERQKVFTLSLVQIPQVLCDNRWASHKSGYIWKDKVFFWSKLCHIPGNHHSLHSNHPKSLQ